MELLEIQSYIIAAEQNNRLYKAQSFNERLDVIDDMEFHVINRLEELILKAEQPDQLQLLKHRAEEIQACLEEINANLFKKLRAKIQTAGYTGTAFENMVRQYVDFDVDNRQQQGKPDYDNLDIFINGLLSFQAIPNQTKDLAPDMVYYQKTPARVVFELAEKINFIKSDVFFDLGSGLGQVAIHVNLLTGITARGVEFEPAFCNYAADCAAGLNLLNVSFINADARNADYTDGTVFFMFTPFIGEMLQEVLERLRVVSLLRKIRIITYGPCTAQVATQSWLHSADQISDNSYQMVVFSSI